MLSACATTSESSKPKITRDFIFAERTGVKLTADWHPALNEELARDKKAPACIVIHGGGWYKGDKKDMESVAVRLSESGIAAMNMNYRLAPEHRFPAPVLDTKDAIRWIKGNAKSLGIDADRVCMIGYSAGAHLALMAGFTLPSDGLDDTKPPSAKIFKFPGGEP
jgi:acetyl esterase/lipase